jgi:hypothetical protein
VLDELGDGLAQHALAEEHHVRQALVVDGCLEPRDSGGLPRFWFFLKQRSSWVWFLATAAKALAAGPRGRWPRPGCRLQSAATIRPVQTEARRTA